jgi:hypothetical protein
VARGGRYDAASGVDLAQKTWQSRLTPTSFATFAGSVPAPAMATDATGALNNQCPVSYVKGTTDTTVSFPETYSGTQFSICSVSRYTSTTGANRLLQGDTNCARAALARPAARAACAC